MGQNVLLQGKLNTDRTKVQEVYADSNGRLQTALMTLLNGEFPQYNRIGAMPIWSYVDVTTDGIVFNGSCLFGGVKVLTAGTSITMYDNTAASGTALINAAATTSADDFISPFGDTTNVSGPSAALVCVNGLYLDLTGGTYRVFYVPGV